MTLVPKHAPLLLGVLVILSFLICSFFYTGFFASDDIWYLVSAQTLAGKPSLKLGNMGSMRLGLIGPAALTYRLSGGSVFLTIFQTVIYPPLMVLISYFIARPIFGIGTALLTAFIVATMPIFYVFAGALLPDNLLSLWLALTLLLLTLNYERKEAGALPLLAGLTLGLGYTVKETALIMFVPVGCFFLLTLRPVFSRKFMYAALLFAFGFGIIILSETFILGQMLNSSGPRILASQNAESVATYKMRIAQQGLYPLERFKFLAGRLWPFLGWGFPALLGTLFLAPIALWLDKGVKNRVMGLVVFLFFAWPLLYLTFGTTNFTQYLPPPIQHQRYYAICMLPAAVLFAHLVCRCHSFLCAAFGSKSARMEAAFAVILIAPILLWSGKTIALHSISAGSQYRSAETKAVLEAVRDATEYEPALPIVFSKYTSKRFLPLFESSAFRQRYFFTLSARKLAEKSAPRPPFLFVCPKNPDYEDSTRNFMKRTEATGKIKMQLVKRGMYVAPYGRMSEIRYYLYPLLNGPALSQVSFADEHRGYELYLVESSSEQDWLRSVEEIRLKRPHGSSSAGQPFD